MSSIRRSCLSAVLPLLHLELLGRLQELRECCDRWQADLQRPAHEVPTLRSLLDELRQIDSDFAELTIDWQARAVSASTEPVTLGGVDLGPFAVKFFWDRLGGGFNGLCFDVVALEPNPSGVHDGVTHPHVKHDKLCAGDATVPLQRALEQGRLAGRRRARVRLRRRAGRRALKRTLR